MHHPAQVVFPHALLRDPVGEHPWPAVVPPGAVDRFNAGRERIQLTLVEPIVAKVSDMARTNGALRHGARFGRLRPDSIRALYHPFPML